MLLHYSFSCLAGDDTTTFDLRYEFVVEHSDAGGRISYPEQPLSNGPSLLVLPIDHQQHGWKSKSFEDDDFRELHNLLMSTRLPLKLPDSGNPILGYSCDHHLRIQSGASVLQIEWHSDKSPFPWTPIAQLGDFFEWLYCKYIEAKGRQTINGWRIWQLLENAP
jgi:hypothetical protein